MITIINVQFFSQHGTPPTLQTKLGKVVSQVLGTTTEVYKLDQARARHKSKPKSREIYDDYLTKLAPIQTKTLAKLQEIKEAFSKWEREFYSKHGILASNEDVKNDQTATQLLNKRKHASELLKQWNINFY